MLNRPEDPPVTAYPCDLTPQSFPTRPMPDLDRDLHALMRGVLVHTAALPSPDRMELSADGTVTVTFDGTPDRVILWAGALNYDRWDVEWYPGQRSARFTPTPDAYYQKAGSTRPLASGGFLGHAYYHLSVMVHVLSLTDPWVHRDDMPFVTWEGLKPTRYGVCTQADFLAWLGRDGVPGE